MKEREKQRQLELDMKEELKVQKAIEEERILLKLEKQKKEEQESKLNELNWINSQKQKKEKKFNRY